MDSRKILIAFDSLTIRSLLANFLREANYEVFEADNGIDALKGVYSYAPDCVVASTELPLINGYDLCHLIKKSWSTKDTVMILASSDEKNESVFWAENSGSDGFYIPSSNNMHILCNIIERKLDGVDKGGNSAEDHKTMDEKDIIRLVIQNFGEELFNLYIIRTVFTASNYIWEIEDLLKHMAKTMSGVFNYDILGIIVNDDPLVEYYDHNDSISHADFEEFRKICQSDFRYRIPNRKEYNWKKSRMTESVIEEFSMQKEKLKNYDLYPLDGTKKFPITVHTANCGMGTVNSRTRKRIDFVTEIYSPLIEKTIAYKKTIETEKKIRTAFERFLPAKVIDSIVQGDTSITSSVGEQRKVAILMADIRDFTPISEKNRPEDVIAFLNKYFSHMGNIIKKHGGTIDKFMGDCIMALFGVPESYRYNGDRAANAALEMISEIRNIDTSMLELPEGTEISIGIGIHYGTPIAGTIGSDDKKEYTVIGDAVNLAARVEELTKQYGVSVIVTGDVKRDMTEAEHDLEMGRYNCEKIPYYLRYLDIVKVKGKSIPVEIFELTGDTQKYSREFIENYNKAMYQYRVGNFSGAQDYLWAARRIHEDDMATKIILERCKEFAAKKPENWDGAITLTSK